MKNLYLVHHLVFCALVAISFVACGKDDSAESGSTPDKPSGGGGVKKRHLQSISLATKADLPDCDASNDTQLAYIRDEATFYVCSSGEWGEVDIKGRDGNNGKDGADGQDAVPTDPNAWKDSLSGLTWLIGGVGTYAQAQASCSGLYRMPTEAESFAAINHGLLSKINPQVLWMGNGWGGGLASGVPAEINVAWSSGQSIACIKL